MASQHVMGQKKNILLGEQNKMALEKGPLYTNVKYGIYGVPRLFYKWIEKQMTQEYWPTYKTYTKYKCFTRLNVADWC